MGKSIIPEEYRLTDIFSEEEDKEQFSFKDDSESIDDTIAKLIGQIGRHFDLDSVVVKEKNDRSLSLKCTYEWRSDGNKKLINIERRYIDDVWGEWDNIYRCSVEGVYRYYRGDECPIRIIRKHEVESLVQVPMYRASDFIGCIDFSDSKRRRDWTEIEIMQLKKVCHCLSSWYFKVRDSEKVRRELDKKNACDSVTRLPKFDVFCKKVNASINSDDGMGLAIISSDITNFKFVNEKYGYSIGDIVLRCFAEKVYECMNRVVACCREYSDNFLIAVKFPTDESDDSLRYRIDRCNVAFIRDAKEKLFDSNLVINTGIYFVGDGAFDIEAAISNATLARKHAKELTSLSGSRSVMFKERMNEEIKRSMELVFRMEPAIRAGEFMIFLQPKVECETLKIVGSEALIRWKCQNGRFIYPDEFIPAFERDGCIVRMDYFVYESVFKYIRCRLDQGKKVVPVSMNVSRVHLFSTAFIKFIEQLMDRYKVPVEYLEFEITENVYIDDLPMVLYTLERLHEYHIKISIDDFGSGYSSLDVLSSLPIDVLKLDKVFMKEELEENDKIIIRCLIQMAEKLDMKVLCEGVETEEQRRFLIEAGCHEMQGYYYSRPVPTTDFDNMLDKED